jgi:ubiquinone/menaquinone biosynthesis C-methylase UbiE
MQRARRLAIGNMNALDWDHNAYYHRLLLRHLPRPCNRVLDVGCGAGAFAVELAERAGHVDAVADVLQEPLPDARYDAIVSASS